MALKLLDLFCGAGGAGSGYRLAGFDVLGVDLYPMPENPHDFVQGDAIEFLLAHGHEFDLIHASPPCQAYTTMQRINTRAPKRDHSKLIEPVRDALIRVGRPYVIENVPGAPLVDTVRLCGSMFDLRVQRHRLFECSFGVRPLDCRHVRGVRSIAVYGDHPQQPGDKTYRVNRARTLSEGREAMGIAWMTWKPLTQAIPPAYTHYIATEFLRGEAK